MKYYDKLIFELSKKGRTGYSLPADRFPAAPALPASLCRGAEPALPEPWDEQPARRIAAASIRVLFILLLEIGAKGAFKV